VLTITNTTLAGNASDLEFGGAIAAHALGPDDFLKVVSCTLSNNQAGEEGGGIHIEAGSRLRLENSIVAGNSASNAGPSFVVRSKPNQASISWPPPPESMGPSPAL
jgi:hypothetical protein